MVAASPPILSSRCLSLPAPPQDTGRRPPPAAGLVVFFRGNEGGSEGQTHLRPELCNAHTFLPASHYQADFFEGYRRDSSALI